MTEADEGGQGLLVVKTSQGLEYIEVKSRTTTEKSANPEQSQKVATYTAEDHTDKGENADGGSDWEDKDKKNGSPVKNGCAMEQKRAKRQQPEFGMSKEVYELYMDLEEKWSQDNITAKLRERVKDHLRVNSTTRNNMLASLDKMSEEFKAKAQVSSN